MKKRYIFLFAVTLVLIGADQATKWWAATSLAERRVERASPACNDTGPIERRVRYRATRSLDVIEGMLSLRYVENCAGAFGILSDQSEAVRRPFFLAVSAAAVVFIVLLFRRLRPEQRLLTVALPFVLGGALGNLIDRVHLRYVIDWVDMYHESIGRWPTYNVADAAIVVGVGLILLDMFPRRRPRKAEGLPEKKATAPKAYKRAEPKPKDDEATSGEEAPPAPGEG